MPTLEGKLVQVHGHNFRSFTRGACCAMRSAEAKDSATAIDLEPGANEGRQETDDEGCVFDAACGPECPIWINDDLLRQSRSCLGLDFAGL